MRYACKVCGRVTDQPRCPEHRRIRDNWSPTRIRSAQAKFRKEVLERDGYRCTYIIANGERCPVEGAENLRAAHHPKPLREFHPDDPAAYSVESGTTLCVEHDRLLDPHAR